MEAVVRNGIVEWINGTPFGVVQRAGCEYLPLPEQDVSALFGRDKSGDIEFKPFAYPGKLTVYEDAAGMAVDRETGTAISAAMHPLCGTEEQLGLLRDQLVQILNALGMKATAGFARLNKVAITEIEAGRVKKEGLDA